MGVSRCSKEEREDLLFLVSIRKLRQLIFLLNILSLNPPYLPAAAVFTRKHPIPSDQLLLNQ